MYAVTAVADPAPADLVVRQPWMPFFNIQYFLGVDGISLSLLILTSLISVLSCLASWNDRQAGKRVFLALFAAGGEP